VITEPLAHVPLAPFTTLGIGGPARYFMHGRSEKTVVEAIELSRAKRLPLLVMGGGSNLLVCDDGFPGVVVRMEISGLEWKDEGDRMRLLAGAGEEWDVVVAGCVEQQLYGVECLSGIPGSVGGTPIQNVGAYGQEVAATISRVRVFDLHSLAFADMNHAECGFSYRKSVFNTAAAGRYVVMQVEYVLSKEGEPNLQYPELQKELAAVPRPGLSEVREVVRRVRARKAMLIQPDDPDSRSAGSFFKNPILADTQLAGIEKTAGSAPPRYPAEGGIKTSAAWLIEHAGFHKGYSRGRAGISRKHTLALVNKGGATAAEILALAREIRGGVEERFAVRLEPEPVFAGFAGQGPTFF
jgi:UDP-N-acetylmuramate dehydrogenase